MSFSASRGYPLVAASRGCPLVAVHGLLNAVVSLVAEHRLWGMLASVIVVPGLSSCSSGALEHRLNSAGTQALLL